MATIKYLLQSKSENAPIYLRLSMSGGINIKRKTGLNINPKNWSKKNGAPLTQNVSGENKNIKPKLLKLSSKIYDRINSASKDGLEINGDWLQYQIDLHFKRISEDTQSELVTDAIQTIIDTSSYRKNGKGGIGLSKSRVNSYKSLLRIFKDYQKQKNSLGYKVKEVNVKFANDFLKHLIDDKRYSTSYAIKKIADLKTVCFDAETNGIEAHPQLKKINTARPQNENIIYLTPSELNQIAKSDKIKGKALNNARRWLLLGCNIGQRGGDLLSITEDNFVTRNGYDVIELKQQKTGKNVTIPVLETTKQILEDGLPYKISIQKLNSYFKDVCELAGIDKLTKGGIVKVTERGKGNKKKRKVYGTYPKYKLVTTHVCRRSFATNLYGVLPTPLIMRITAHSTEKMFLNYIGKDSLDYAQQIADFYKLQSLKAEKEPQLKVIGKTANE